MTSRTVKLWACGVECSGEHERERVTAMSERERSVLLPRMRASSMGAAVVGSRGGPSFTVEQRALVGRHGCQVWKNLVGDCSMHLLPIGSSTQSGTLRI
jgi:hypothetical protein